MNHNTTITRSAVILCLIAIVAIAFTGCYAEDVEEEDSLSQKSFDFYIEISYYADASLQDPYVGWKVKHCGSNTWYSGGTVTPYTETIKHRCGADDIIIFDQDEFDVEMDGLPDHAGVDKTSDPCLRQCMVERAECLLHCSNEVCDEQSLECGLNCAGV